jgi:hypothetical protein
METQANYNQKVYRYTIKLINLYQFLFLTL